MPDAPSTSSNSSRILIVDDEKIMTELFKLALESERYRVDVANKCDDAESLFAATDYDLVMLDIMLEEKTGIDLLNEFKQAKPGVPVVMVTGSGKVEHAVECFKYGAADLLAKPIDIPDLLKAVKQNLKPPEKIEAELCEENLPNMPGYQFIKRLGEGSMGIVYLAQKSTDLGGNRQFAVKVFKEDTSKVSSESAANPEFLRERFMREASAAYSLQHPNIIKVYEFATNDDGIPYIVMEYFEGLSLADYCKKHELYFKEKCKLFLQVSQALQLIHENGICHRDIKPNNIIVDATGKVKIMDFGIARLKDSTLTMTDHIMGTPNFMSPEAFESAKVDHRSDIFSFGILMYTLITGEQPFENTDILTLVNSTRSDTPRWPSEMGIDLPPLFENCIKKMLEKKPDDRFQSMSQVTEILRSFA